MIKDPLDFINGGYKTFCRSILCLNGTMPDESFFKNIYLPLIAADGGLDQLLFRSIIPDLVIGDLDTVNPLNLTKTKSIKIVDESTFDFEKALDYLKQEDLLPTLVLGVNGGYLDQIINNMHIILRNNLIFYDPPLIGITITECQEFNLPLHTKLSFFGNATLSTKGLMWNLDNEMINFPHFCSVSNRTLEETVRITPHDGKVTVLIYL